MERFFAAGLHRLVAAALGVGLLAFWVLGSAYGAPEWMSYGYLALGIVVLAGLGALRTRDTAGIATWPLAGVFLLALWLFGIRGEARWMAWLSFMFGLAFIALTVAFTLHPLQLRRRRLSGQRWEHTRLGLRQRVRRWVSAIRPAHTTSSTGLPPIS